MERVSNIIYQYKKVVGALNGLFNHMDLRSEVQSWRFDGVGSCRNCGRCMSEFGITGPAKLDLISLRDEVNFQVKGSNTLSQCPYYRDSIGCILGDLKSPLCIAHVDNPGNLKRFRIDGYRLTFDIQWTLDIILRQDMSKAEQELGVRVAPDGFTEIALDAVSQMVNWVKTYPELKMEERTLLQRNKFYPYF